MTSPLRKSLLFVTSNTPDLHGSGIAMRAALQLRCLLRVFDVTLLIIDDPGSAIDPALSDLRVAGFMRAGGGGFFANLWARWEHLLGRRLALELLWPAPPRWARNAPGLADGVRRLGGRTFDAVHCFRLQNAPATKLLKRAGVRFARSVVDLDDYESKTMWRGARTFARTHGLLYTIVRLAESVKWHILESAYLPRFDAALVCSESDRAALSKRFRDARFVVVANTVVPPPFVVRQEAGAFNILFVGSLDYEPNHDGILFFAAEVLPLIRRRADREVQLTIVGRNADEAIRALGREDGIVLVEGPPSVAPYYAGADLAIAPIRAGGGTRIKIIEAFAFRVPVVATTIGAEGLDVTPGQHLCVADGAEAFGEQCRLLIGDPVRRQAVAESAFALFRERYSAERLPDMLAAAYPELCQGGV